MNRMSIFLRSLLFRALERLLARKEQEPANLLYHEVQRILIIRPQDGLGDLLLATPVLSAVKERFPEAKIGLLTRADFGEFVKNHPALDELLTVKDGITQWLPHRFLPLIRRLRGCDLAVVLMTRTHSLRSDLLALFSGARFILGSEAHPFPGCKSNFLYDFRAPYSSLAKHETERNLDIVRSIGVDTDQLCEEIVLTSEDRSLAQQKLIEFGLKPDDMIVMFYFSSIAARHRFQVSEAVHLTKYFSTTYNARIMVWSAFEHRGWAQEFLDGLPFKPIEVCDLTLREHLFLHYFSDLVLCHDDVIMHLVAGVGTPFIARFSETDPYLCKPIGPQFMDLRIEEGEKQSYSSKRTIALSERLLSKFPKSERLKAGGFDISESVLQPYLDNLGAVKD